MTSKHLPVRYFEIAVVVEDESLLPGFGFNRVRIVKDHLSMRSLERDASCATFTSRKLLSLVTC